MGDWGSEEVFVETAEGLGLFEFLRGAVMVRCGNVVVSETVLETTVKQALLVPGVTSAGRTEISGEWEEQLHLPQRAPKEKMDSTGRIIGHPEMKAGESGAYAVVLRCAKAALRTLTKQLCIIATDMLPFTVSEPIATLPSKNTLLPLPTLHAALS